MERCLRGFLFLIVIIHLIDGTSHSCNSRQFQCSDQKQCIPLSWQCDGEKDCHDQSDETRCRYKPCGENEFQCFSKKCISKTDVCDGFDDCPDGEDELKHLCHKETACNSSTHFMCSRGKTRCIPKHKVCDGKEDCMDLSDETLEICSIYKKNVGTLCDRDEFNCTSGGCISSAFRCDGKKDCEDNSDEKNCQPRDACKSDEFRCLSGTPKCIDLSKRCDDYRECSDGSDERDCPMGFDSVKKCPLKTDFYCGIPGKCITDAWRCDGEPDCPNAADERNCVSTTCPPPKIACNKGNKCLHPSQKCNGIVECPDRSDEENCPVQVKKDECKNKFVCGSGSKKCVDWSKVCDGRADCMGGEDEQPGGSHENCRLNLCEKINGGCTHICQNHYTHRTCACPPGLQLQNDKETCVDINECEIWGSCSQNCENTKGSYKCSCDIGYVVKRLNKSRCAANVQKSILLATQEYIREYHLETYDERLIVSDLINVGGLEYDLRSDPYRVFWTQPTPPALYMSTFGQKNKDVKQKKVELFSGKDSVPEGLAYDWIHELLYITDPGLKIVSVLNVSAPRNGISVIASGDIEEPRGIAVDPLNGWVYWSDWGRKAKISKVGMDGRFRQVLVDTDIMLPNDVALDMPQRRLYWCDAKLHTISTIKLDGTDRRLIYNDSDIYPYAISVFEDRVYWSDWHYESVLWVNKFHASMHEKLFYKHRISAIRIMHKLLEPDMINRCVDHLCSHFCLPSPSIGNLKKDPSYKCACPVNMVLEDNDRTCVKNTTTSTVRTTEVSVVKTTLTDTSTAKSSGTSTTSTISTPTTTTVRLTTYTDVVVSGSSSTFKGNETATPSKNTTILTTKLGPKPVGHVAGIAIGVIILIFVIVTVALMVLYRVYGKRNIRSMNFDNPVYRKANGEADTEAQYPITGSVPNNNRSARTPIWTGEMDDAVEA